MYLICKHTHQSGKGHHSKGSLDCPRNFWQYAAIAEHYLKLLNWNRNVSFREISFETKFCRSGKNSSEWTIWRITQIGGSIQRIRSHGRFWVLEGWYCSMKNLTCDTLYGHRKLRIETDGGIRRFSRSTYTVGPGHRSSTKKRRENRYW